MPEKPSFMERAAAFIVEKNKLFLLLFIALMLFSLVSVGWVQVENDITVYLPENTEARRGLRIMAEEYPELASKVRVMLPDEKTRRVGQSVAAASLPEVRK